MAFTRLPESADFPLVAARRERTRREGEAQHDQRFDEPLLTVLIVNYCQWQETTALVRQLRQALSAQQGAVEIVVVDNHSPPHAAAWKLGRLPGVSVRQQYDNRGFASAVNEGGRISRAPWLLLLNPDVRVDENFVDEVLVLSERLSAHEPRTGVVGLRLHNADGSEQSSAGPYPTLPGILLGLLRPRSRRKYLRRLPAQRGPVPWVTGCGLLVRRDCLHELGGFEDRFFLYYEDVDFCQRARAAGWEVCFEPSLSLTHLHPLQNRVVSSYLRVLTRHALLTYAALHWPPLQAAWLANLVAAEARCRRWLAWWREDADAAELFAELELIAAELARGETQAAHRRLRRLVQQEGLRRATDVLRGHPQPQPARPAPGLPAECLPAGAR